MVGFLGAQALYDQEFDAQNNFLIFGVGPAADCIRESSLYISPHSPALRRNFNNFYAFDSQERLQDASLVLGETSADFQLPVIYVGGTICAPYMTCWLGEAYEINALPHERTVWYVGCRDYSPEEGEWARYNQRFLPSSELEVEVALKTALAELNGAPCRLMLNIDALDPVWAPAVRRQAGFGHTPVALLKALRCLEGSSVTVVQVCGLAASENAWEQKQTARLAAEFGRELALTIFPFKLQMTVPGST